MKAKKKAVAAKATTPNPNRHDFLEMSMEVEQCADTLTIASQDAETLDSFHQERLSGVVRLVARDLARLQQRLTSLYDETGAS